jgi:hypothetical protein
MRSGKWLHAGLCGLVLTLTLGAGQWVERAVSAEPTAAALSRRLPYRRSATAVSVTTARPSAPLASSTPTANRSAAVAGRTRASDVELADYTQEDGTTESIMMGSEVLSSPVTSGAEFDPVWTPTQGVIEGDGACCEGGPVCWPGIQLNHLSVFGGLQAVKNNSTRGEDASFGFHEGLNFGTAARNIILPPSMGLQVGFQALQSNIEGASFTNDDRKQYFLTAGAFRRSDHGLQGGLVYDHLWDTWNYELKAGQLRGELSIAISPLSSFGFWFADSVNEDDVTARVSGVDVAETWDTVDYYALFYRTGLFAGGRGEGQMMAGLTEDSDGIIGGKSRMPLINGWALESEFTYMVPDEPRGAGANEHESWNLGISLVWYPGSLSCGECFREHRPMFDVANNGSMILRRTP